MKSKLEWSIVAFLAALFADIMSWIGYAVEGIPVLLIIAVLLSGSLLIVAVLATTEGDV